MQQHQIRVEYLEEGKGVTIGMGGWKGRFLEKGGEDRVMNFGVIIEVQDRVPTTRTTSSARQISGQCVISIRLSGSEQYIPS